MFLDIRRSFSAFYHDLLLCSPFGSGAALTRSLCSPITSPTITGMREAAGGRRKYYDDGVGGVP